MSDVSESVRHMKIVIELSPAIEESEVWQIKKQNLGHAPTRSCGMAGKTEGTNRTASLRNVCTWWNWARFWDGLGEWGGQQIREG